MSDGQGTASGGENAAARKPPARKPVSAGGRTGRPKAAPPPTRGRGRTVEERRALAAQWVHPPVAPSIARGLAVVGTSPQILISGFLAALVLWLGFVA